MHQLIEKVKVETGVSSDIRTRPQVYLSYLELYVRDLQVVLDCLDTIHEQYFKTEYSDSEIASLRITQVRTGNSLLLEVYTKLASFGPSLVAGMMTLLGGGYSFYGILKTKAQVEKIRVEAKKGEAEVEKVHAETAKIRAETEKLHEEVWKNWDLLDMDKQKGIQKELKGLLGHWKETVHLGSILISDGKSMIVPENGMSQVGPLLGIIESEFRHWYVDKANDRYFSNVADAVVYWMGTLKGNESLKCRYDVYVHLMNLLERSDFFVPYILEAELFATVCKHRYSAER